MIDNHLYDIKIVDDDSLKKMSNYRQLFIALDEELVRLGVDPRGHRQLAIARTNLENALMYCMKTIAIQGEKRRL